MTSATRYPTNLVGCLGGTKRVVRQTQRSALPVSSTSPRVYLKCDATLLCTKRRVETTKVHLTFFWQSVYWSRKSTPALDPPPPPPFVH